MGYMVVAHIRYEALTCHGDDGDGPDPDLMASRLLDLLTYIMVVISQL